VHQIFENFEHRVLQGDAFGDKQFAGLLAFLRQRECDHLPLNLDHVFGEFALALD